MAHSQTVEALKGYQEFEACGGMEGVIDLDANRWNDEVPIFDEDGEIAYERMLSDRASWETELDARHGC